MSAPYETHRAQLKAILSAWGMPKDNAEATADILSWADLHGIDSHGISMLPGYDRLRRSGRANMAARPRVIKETPVSALVDTTVGSAMYRRVLRCKSQSTRPNSRAWRSQRCATRRISAPPAITP